jgi:hypothetical protein
MEYDAMVERFKMLYQELLTDRAIGERIRNKMRYLREPLYSGGYGARESLQIIWRLVTRGILPGGPSRWVAFARSLPLMNPAQIPSVISDWIIGLSMADFARRQLDAPSEAKPVSRRIAARRLTAPA